MKTNPVELLSPAKNAEYGIAAINFGADSVYIGAPRFGARASAGNSIQDIETLCNYAHRFHSKVFVALNTILFDHELSEAEKMIHRIYEAGADALIIQDMGILEMDLPPISLHASTQANNTHPEQIGFLEKVGFDRVILARELSLSQIQEIRNKTHIELEAFVHGALCVSYSGQCYMSAFIGSRSGNRGECAQPCRLQYNLLDERNTVIERDTHALSLRDMNRGEFLYEMLNAGVTAFKIEGRMKDIGYVKNVTAFYRKKLDKIIANNERYAHASLGHFRFDFEPDPDKTFNRRYSDYFLHNREAGITSKSPKSVGKPIGKVIEVGYNYITINTREKFNNGDGLCFFMPDGKLNGFSVQQSENNRVFTSESINIKIDTLVYRNSDLGFSKLLAATENARFIDIDLHFKETENGFMLSASTTDELYHAESSIEIEKNPARDEKKASETVEQQLRKTGGTSFVINELKIEWGSVWFIPIGELNRLRREALEKLSNLLGTKFNKSEKELHLNNEPYFQDKLDYKANVSNLLSQKFWKRHGVSEIDDAFELSLSNEGCVLMTTKLCLRFEADACPVHRNASNKTYPHSIELNGTMFHLEYDCKACEMKIVK
ncbi:MAG: collagenase-like protease [Bacteroidetes bacterium HGW-Bacteroidetes-6]|jgi:putative protease|nr:MAG: collagenase-like protease [Bacteroidetes bacterium HGW-Bacteroidetes-6]